MISSWQLWITPFHYHTLLSDRTIFAMCLHLRPSLLSAVGTAQWLPGLRPGSTASITMYGSWWVWNRRDTLSGHLQASDDGQGDKGLATGSVVGNGRLSRFLPEGCRLISPLDNPLTTGGGSPPTPPPRLDGAGWPRSLYLLLAWCKLAWPDPLQWRPEGWFACNQGMNPLAFFRCLRTQPCVPTKLKLGFYLRVGFCHNAGSRGRLCHHPHRYGEVGWGSPTVVTGGCQGGKFKM